MFRMRAVLLCLGVTCVLTSGACKTGGPTEPSPTSEVLYGVIGASDAVGFGSSAPCLPFEDCNGNGYAQLVKRRFQSDGATVQVANRGLPGAVLSPAMRELGREIGRNDIEWTITEQGAPFIPTTPTGATHVSIFVGGNDTNLIAQAIRAGRAGTNIAGFIDQYVNQFGADLNQMVMQLRGRLPNARLVAMNLPNLAMAPYVNALSVSEKSILQRIAVGITDRINALTGQNVVVIDLMCEPRLYTAANFSSDGFHPSDAGYALMADVLYPALRNGSAPGPSNTCSQRTTFPVF